MPGSSDRSDLSTWLRLIRAIMQRELRSRYTGDKVGYAWSLLIPLMWILLIWAFFQMFRRPVPIDTDAGSFIFTGVIPYVSFRFTLSAVMRSKLTYHNLFIMPRVSPEIVCFSVALLEVANAFFIYGIVLTGNWVFYGPLEISQPSMIIFGLFLACLLGSTLAYMVVSLIPNVRFALRAMQIVVRPIFYLSGVFYIVAELPNNLQEWLWFNPLIHAVEIVRTGAFGDFGSRVTQAWLPLLYCVVFVLIGSIASRRGGVWGDDTEEQLL